MPQRWLVKTEPSSYSFADLLRDRRTSWEGVANALALIHLRAMSAGDPVLVYHTGREKAVVGLFSRQFLVYKPQSNPGCCGTA